MQDLPFPEPVPPEGVIDRLTDKIFGPDYYDSDLSAWETAKEERALKLRRLKEKEAKPNFDPEPPYDPNTFWVRASDAALSLGVTRRRVGQLCEGKRIRARKIGRRWAVDSESVLDYAQNRAEQLDSKRRFFLVNVRAKIRRRQVKEEIEQGGSFRGWRAGLERQGEIEPTDWERRKAAHEADLRQTIDYTP
jgi:hypothetical protein